MTRSTRLTLTAILTHPRLPLSRPLEVLLRGAGGSARCHVGRVGLDPVAAIAAPDDQVDASSRCASSAERATPSATNDRKAWHIAHGLTTQMTRYDLSQVSRKLLHRPAFVAPETPTSAFLSPYAAPQLEQLLPSTGVEFHNEADV
jgi:hypothetical protein